MVEMASAPPFEPPPRDARLAEFLGIYPPSVFSERLYRSIELMERYTIDLSIDILSRLRVIDQLDDWRSPSELCELLSFEPRFRFALRWLLRRLVETNCIKARCNGDASTDHQFRLQTLPWLPQLEDLRSIGLELDRANKPTLELLDKAASLYPAVASGEQTGEQALFGTQGIPLWLNYFSNENSTYAVNNWIGAIAACKRLPEGREFRILELGAGASSGSEILLRCLQERNLLSKLEHYLITEPNAFFLRRGQRELLKRHSNFPLEFRSVDIDQTWRDQGINPGEFDLIYGVNVLHVAKNLVFTLRQAREALADKGCLIIGECVRPHLDQPIYVELIFQLLDSFTEVMLEPEIRPNPGFLTANQWEASFRRSGFNSIEVTPNIEAIRDIYPHFFTAAICGRV
jgi:SAM-dependent methyltransferase